MSALGYNSIIIIEINIQFEIISFDNCSDSIHAYNNKLGY